MDLKKAVRGNASRNQEHPEARRNLIQDKELTRPGRNQGCIPSVNVLWISAKAETLQLLIRGKCTLFIFLFTLIEAKVVLFPLIFLFMH